MFYFYFSGSDREIGEGHVRRLPATLRRRTDPGSLRSQRRIQILHRPGNEPLKL